MHASGYSVQTPLGGAAQLAMPLWLYCPHPLLHGTRAPPAPAARLHARLMRFGLRTGPSLLNPPTASVTSFPAPSWGHLAPPPLDSECSRGGDSRGTSLDLAFVCDDGYCTSVHDWVFPPGVAQPGSQSPRRSNVLLAALPPAPRCARGLNYNSNLTLNRELQVMKPEETHQATPSRCRRRWLIPA